jgi:hypothetical protein
VAGSICSLLLVDVSDMSILLVCDPSFAARPALLFLRRSRVIKGLTTIAPSKLSIMIANGTEKGPAPNPFRR